MRIDFTKQFFKQLAKLRKTEQDKFWHRLESWKADPQLPILHTHKLTGKFNGFYSINVGGDLRALYKILDDGTVVVFELIGTHSQLYG